MKQYAYTIEASRLAMFDNPTQDEQEILTEHDAYIQQLMTSDTGVFVGEVSEKNSQYFGIVIFQAEGDDTAKSILHNDPVVSARIMRGCLYPFRISLWNKDAMSLAEGQSHYFYKIRPIRPEMLSEGGTDEENQIMGQHFMYLKALTEKAIFAFAGPTLVLDYSNFGTGLLRADSLEDAWQIGNNDPAVINRVMRLDILPFSVAYYQQGFV